MAPGYTFGFAGTQSSSSNVMLHDFISTIVDDPYLVKALSVTDKKNINGN